MNIDDFTYAAASQAYDYQLTIDKLLVRTKLVNRNQTIHYAKKLSYTYNDFFKRINRLANVLVSLGLKQGDTVAFMEWDTHRYLEAYFAVPMLGLILQTVNVRLSPDKVLYTINHARPKVVFLNSDFANLIKSEAIQDHRNDIPSVERVVWLDDNGVPKPRYAIGEYEAMMAQASDEFDFPNLSENTIAATFYTSGTTGNPKGVFFTHRQIVLHALACTATMGVMPENSGMRLYDVYMPMTPMFHVMAWGMPYIATMLGLKQVYPGRYLPATLVELIDDFGVTCTHSVPTILQMILAEKAKKGGTFVGVKMGVAGSAMTEGLAKQALQAGIQVRGGFGMSETGPVLTIVTPTAVNDGAFSSDDELDELIKIRTSTGTPALLVDLQIWDTAGNRLPNDGSSVGEIVVRTPWLTPTYTRNPSAGEELWAGGYLHTQDIGHLSPDGTLKITDRLKDVIKSGGEWISSLEIETILSLHPSVADLSVIGIPDPKWDEKALAIVVKKQGFEATTADDILALARQAFERGIIPKYGIPTLVFVDAIPKTSVGKNDKKVLRTMVADGTIVA